MTNSHAKAETVKLMAMLYGIGGNIMNDRTIKKSLGIREDKVCKCGKIFTPERAGHYLCNECFEKNTSRAF